MPYLFVDIPEGESIVRVDLSDPKNPVAVLSGENKTDLTKLQEELERITTKVDENIPDKKIPETLEEIKAAKAAHPEAEVLSHPECPAKVLELSDFVGSTSEIIAQAGKSDAKEFIICTESGVLYELQKRNPEKKFYFTETTPICRNMKKVTLEKVLHVLKTGENEVFVDDKLREESKKPLERMLELAK